MKTPRPKPRRRTRLEKALSRVRAADRYAAILTMLSVLERCFGPEPKKQARAVVLRAAILSRGPGEHRLMEGDARRILAANPPDGPISYASAHLLEAAIDPDVSLWSTARVVLGAIKQVLGPEATREAWRDLVRIFEETTPPPPQLRLVHDATRERGPER